eukprot:c15016_g3_i1 orf=2-412(-)
MLAVETSLGQDSKSVVPNGVEILQQLCNTDISGDSRVEENQTAEEVAALLAAYNTMQETGAFVVPDSNSFGQKFRVYDADSERRLGVEEFYRIQHINQTYDFALQMLQRHCELNKGVMGVWECCELLNEFVDESDPD